MGWEALANGVLLRAAAAAEFDAFLSIDKKMEYEQNLRLLPLPVIILNTTSTALPALLPFAPLVIQLLKVRPDRVLFVVDSDGTIHRLTTARPK